MSEQYKIGRITGVLADRLTISLDDHILADGVDSGVPENMTVNLSGEAGPTPLLIGQPGTFVAVAIPSGQLLAMITGIDMKETLPTAAELKAAMAEGSAIPETHKRELSAVPIGTIAAGGQFERGADILPTVTSPAFAVSPQTINSIYQQYAEGNK